MHVTYKDAKDLLEEIVAEKGADYVYPYDPKAVEAARDYLAKLREKNPTGFFSNGVGADEEGREYARACTYRNVDGTPGCLVGHFVDRLAPGFVMEDEGWNLGLIEGTDITIDDDASELLGEVQSYQDMRYTWGEALRLAASQMEEND